MISQTTSRDTSRGLALAVGAYLIWGTLPIYMILVRAIPPMEFLAWRIIFTLPICLAMLAASRSWTPVLSAMRKPRLLAVLLVTALLIGGNWLVFIIAVTQGQVYAASLGYYMNPLVNIVIGTVFLKERLPKSLWIAVGLATAGVLILLAGALQTLWITMALALSFSCYGLIRKLVPIDAVSGLTIETALLALPAASYLLYLNASPQGLVFGEDPVLAAIVAFSGIVTATPLTMFTVASRQMEYSTIAFTQFVSPSLIFIEGLLLYHEPLNVPQMASFILIWGAIGVFCWDLWRRRARPEVEAA